MELCQTCCSIIRRAHQTDDDITTTFPRLRVRRTPNCWICYKFSQWLKVNDQKNFEAWCHRSLRVKVSHIVRLVPQEPRQTIILPSWVEIRPSSYVETVDTCWLQLSLISATDFAASQQFSPNINTTMGMDLSIVDAWVSECTRRHRKCCQKNERWYPNRLIQLTSAGQKARLVSSKDCHPRGGYITLSHRWVEKSHQIWKSHPILKSATLQKLQKSIDIVHLPQIFQDAIQITAHLGIRYLWIDTLCVLQDDWSDWANESKNLEKIYSSAFLNISATMSFNGLESLFQGSPSASYVPSPIELELNGILQTFFVVNGEMWEDEIENAPLLTRGWVFSERYLACRVLHFGQHQMGWECREQATLQAFPNGLPPTCALYAMSKPQFENMLDNLTRNDVEEDDYKFASKWQNLVHQYSKCAFTDSKDKLVALSGIAERIKQYRDDYYVAGMWKTSMIYDLGWWRSREGRKAFPISETSSRAPSWSWASVDGDVQFTGTTDGKLVHMADIEEVANEVTVQSNVPKTRDFIRIRGPLLPLRVKWSDDEEIDSFEVAHFRFVDNDSPQSSFISFEVPAEEVRDLSQRARLVFLPLSAVPLLSAAPILIHGIALTKTYEVCQYRRVGALQIQEVTDSIHAMLTAVSGNGGQNDPYNGPSPEMLEANRPEAKRSITAIKLLMFVAERPTSVIKVF